MSIFDPDPSGQTVDDRPERAGGRVVVVLVVVLVLLVAGGYAAARAVAGDRVPRGASISGVDVGGLTRAAAVQKLRDAFEPRIARSIDVSVRHSTDGSTEAGAKGADEVAADDLGLRVDYAASVDDAGAGASWAPARQWDYFTGGRDVDAVVDIDEQRLDATLDQLASGLGTPPRDGQVRFTADGVESVAPAAGEEIDRDAAKEALTEAFLQRKASVVLEVEPAQPDIDASDLSEAEDNFANPAMSAPVTLVFGKSQVRLEPARFASALSMKAQNGALVPQVDTARLTALVKRATTDGAPVDATVRVVGGKPQVVPAKPGVSFEPEQVAAVFTGLLTKPEGQRRASVTAKVVEADFTTEDARKLKIVERISRFQTFYPHADYRNVNLGRAAEIIDGTLLKPGETFSLNGLVGERTKANGFTEGYIISDGILRKDLGGGVSQMATTVFNAMFFAGLQDVEHKPHSFYIDRYPVGREATVAWPSVDLRFRNNTPYGVLVKAAVDPSSPGGQGTVTVSMYSTKIWDIDSATSARYAYVPPRTRTLTTPDCEAFTGYSGFQVDVTRIFRKVGSSAVAKREKFHTVYTPADSVRCAKPGAPAPAGTGTD